MNIYTKKIEEDGYVIIKDVFSNDQIDLLNKPLKDFPFVKEVKSYKNIEGFNINQITEEQVSTLTSQ
jgi:hypothetical protein